MKTSSKVCSAIKECLAKPCFTFPAFFFFPIFKRLVFLLENKVAALNLNYYYFFLTIRICWSYPVSQKTIYSKNMVNGFYLLLLFFNPLLLLEVFLKLQLIPKGNFN